MSYSNSSHDEEGSEPEVWTVDNAETRSGRFRGGGDMDDDDDERRTRIREILRWVKMGLLLFLWLIFTTILLVQQEHEHKRSFYLCVPPAPEIKNYDMLEPSKSGRVFMRLMGPFVLHAREETRSARSGSSLTVRILKVKEDNTSEPMSDEWEIDLVDPKLFDYTKLVARRRAFTLTNRGAKDTKIRIEFKTNVNAPLSLELVCEPSRVSVNIGMIMALILIIGYYILLTMDIVHRALSSVIFCTLAISMLALLEMRPSLMTIIGWINFEKLLLLFGLTIIIAIFAETGIIDYLAVRSYEMANGHIWPLLNCLCLITVLGATLFDNIFMILIAAPITLRLCEVMELNPIPVLTCLMVASNIGSAVTPNGESPNDFINQNEYIKIQGVTQTDFVVHILPATITAAAAAYVYMRIQYHNSNKFRYKDGAEVERLRRAIKVWSRTAKSISAYSKDEKIMRDTVMNKVERLRQRMLRLGKMPVPTANYEQTVKDLKKQYPIRNRLLLAKCIVVMTFTIFMILTDIMTDFHHLSTAWTALLGALFLLIIADTEDFDGILGRIEWSTMLFLATVFVFTECLDELGFFDTIGDWTRGIILRSSDDDRLSISIIVILWFSAIGSAFLADNSIGNMMVRVALTSYEEMGTKLPLQPMLWAVVMGCSLGGIGTIVGTYANVICAGVAEKHGYNFPYIYYLKVGFPIMVTTVVATMIYLLIAHVAFEWQ